MGLLTRPLGPAGVVALALLVLSIPSARGEEPGSNGEPAAAEVALAAAPDSTAPPPPPVEEKQSSAAPPATGAIPASANLDPVIPASLTPSTPDSAHRAVASPAAPTGATPSVKMKPPGKKALPVPPAPAAKNTTPTAAPPDEGARVRRELDRTYPILRSVRAKVIRSFNKKAREEYEVAAARQREAREAVNQNLFARAERLTLESRSLARQTAVHLGPPEDDPDYVSMTLGRTDDAIHRAQEVLRDAAGDLERRRLAALERRQKEARELFESGGTRRAYPMTRDVRDGVLTLLRDCDDLPVREETAEKALKRASRALDQAKGELGERMNVAATRLSREARAQMDKARAAFARKNYRDTLLHSKLVERNLELAVSAQRTPTNRTG
jgi:hypothetical protein